MTTTPFTPVIPDIGPRAGGLRLWTPILAHSCTDFLSFVTIALMPLLAVRIGMTIEQKALLLGLGAAASGAIQPVVAWISDRFDSRLTGTLGLATAAVCVGLLGWVESFEQLLLLFFFAVLGVGAFHPASAAAVGQLAGRRRSAMLSVFFLFGMIGGIGGNVLTPLYVHTAGAVSGASGDEAVRIGLRALIWFTPPGLVAAGLLAWAIHRVPHRRVDARENHESLGPVERRRRWIAFWILYAGNVIRFTVNQMLVYLMIEWAERITRTRAGVAVLDVELGQRASELNGPLQAAMQVGMGLGGLAMGLFLPARFEKSAFILVPLVGGVAIAAIPFSESLLDMGRWAVFLPAACCAIVAGAGFGALVPVSMSLGQRLLPHRTSFASGMLLGGAWCIAFVGPQIARAIHAGRDGNLEAGFFASAGVLSIAALLAVMLPGRLLRSVAPH